MIYVKIYVYMIIDHELKDDIRWHWFCGMSWSGIDNYVLLPLDICIDDIMAAAEGYSEDAVAATMKRRFLSKS